VDVDHEGHPEEGREQVRDGHEHEARHHHPGEEHRAPVLGAQLRGLLHRPEPARRHLEVLTPEQVGVRPEERHDVHHGDEEQGEGGEVHQERQAREAQAVEERAAHRQGRAGAVLGEVRALHDLGGVVQEVAGDQRRHRREHVGQRHEEPRAGEEVDEAVEHRVVRAQGIARHVVAQAPRQPEPDQDEQGDRQAERQDEDAAEGAGQHLPPSREGGLDQHAGSQSLGPRGASVGRDGGCGNGLSPRGGLYRRPRAPQDAPAAFPGRSIFA
jgi:hypothetical protein